MFEWVRSTWNKEWPEVKNAPYSVAMFVVGGTIIGAAAILFLYSYFVLPGKDAQISLLQQEKISPQNEKGKPVTQLEVRELLAFIHPWILSKIIDEGKRELHIGLSASSQIKLKELSKRPDFDKFLSVRKSGTHTSEYKSDPNLNFIQEYGEERNYLEGYYFTVKDALVAKEN